MKEMPTIITGMMTFPVTVHLGEICLRPNTNHTYLSELSEQKSWLEVRAIAAITVIEITIEQPDLLTPGNY